MKVTKSFKQTCPSCGAGVPIRDPKLVGKKVDCPECKFRFVVESPKEQPDEEGDKGKKKKAAGKDSKDGKGKEKTGKEKESAKGEGKKKKKAAKAPLASKKLQLGLALGGVGLVILAVAAYLIMGGNSPPAPPPSPPPMPGPDQVAEAPMENPQPEPIKEPEKQPEKPAPMDPPPPMRNTSVTPASEALLTNLLPNDAEHVARVYFKNALSSVAGTAAKEAYPFADADEDFRRRVGFPLSAIDHLLRSERFTAPAWSYTLLHLTEPADEVALVKALNLQPEPPIKNRKLYAAKQTQPWLQRLSRISPGSPESDRLRPQPERPLYVHIYDDQTVIFADKAPLDALLNNDGHFPYAGSGDKNDMGFNVPFGATTYLTIRPDLKAIMDRMEQDAAETILFGSATSMDDARVAGKADPKSPARIAWQLRQLWDVGHLLEVNRAKLKLLGTALYQNESRHLVLRNEIGCVDGLDAKSLEKELQERATPKLAGFLERILDIKIKVPAAKVEKLDGTEIFQPVLPTPPEGGQPGEIPLEEKVSEIRYTRDGKVVDFHLQLVLDRSKYAKLYNAAALVVFGMRSELQLATQQIQRDRLAQAALALGDKGLSVRELEPGSYPPGAFKRPASAIRIASQPNQRVSWMAGLLPFLGHNTVFRRVDFNSSWQDPSNWMAARTLVPEFLDPTYPDEANFVSHPNLQFRVAGTHFVGIAGVGLDAASYPPDDPAYLHKRGVLGYDRSATLAAVQAEHGLANTILAIQVPHDGPAGITPWLAGGGATLRGVPETKSIAPFVLGQDRNGKPIMHNGKRGTFAVMTDGSVRFIDQGISDEVFKAMCTVKGPLPANFETVKQTNTSLVNPPPKLTIPEKTAGKD